jgi:hypothetical protein
MLREAWRLILGQVVLPRLVDLVNRIRDYVESVPAEEVEEIRGHILNPPPRLLP